MGRVLVLKAETQTAVGGRLLKQWLEKPLYLEGPFKNAMR